MEWRESKKKDIKAILVAELQRAVEQEKEQTKHQERIRAFEILSRLFLRSKSKEVFDILEAAQKEILEDPISKEQIEECKHCGHEGRREEGGRCPKKPHTYHDYEPKDSNHLKTAYQEVIADLKKSFDTCKDYDENCLECRAKKARELLKEVVSLGFE